MPTGGPANAGPKSWGFMPTGQTQMVTVAATPITMSLSQYVSTAPYAPSVSIYSLGAAAANSIVFTTFGTNTTVSPTVGAVIVPAGLMVQDGGSRLQVLSTGRRPSPIVVLGGAGTGTLWITPGEGNR